MKIALVTFRFDAQGGAVAVVRMLADALIRRGIEVVIVTSRREIGHSVRREGPLTVHSFRPANLYWVGDKDRQATWRKVAWQMVDTWNPFVLTPVRRILEAEAPDVVHVHKLRGLSPAVWAAAAVAGVPRIIQTCHDYELMSPEGTLAGRAGGWARQGVALLRPYQALRRRCSAAVDVATAPTEFALRQLTDRGFFPGAIHCALPNSHGLTAAELGARRPDTLSARPAEAETRLLFLGRLDRVKGIEVLCRSFVEAARDRPHLRLQIAGWGPLDSSLRARFGDHPRIRFLGEVRGSAKEAALRDCTAVMVPSLVEETFGLVITEAFTFGKPVIASRIGGIPELVTHGRTGLLVKPGDEAELSQTLQRVDQEPELLDDLRGSCFAEAFNYTIDSVVDRHLDLYRAP